MSKDYKRVLNTHHFCFTSANDIAGNAGLRTTFNFTFPPIPQLPNNESKTAILRIHSFYVGSQTAAQNINTQFGGFLIQINGLSLRPTLHTSSRVTNVGPFGAGGTQPFFTNMFYIPNETPLQQAVVGGAAQTTFSGISGGQLNTPIEVICGNPSGQSFSLTLKDQGLFNVGIRDVAANAGAIGNLTAEFNCSIELIDPDDDQNF